MKRHLLLALAVAAASTIGCQREADTKQVDTKTHTETTAAGEPIEKESESAARMPNDGKIDRINTEHNEYVGVVTRFDPGKGLTIKAADGESHSFDLDDRKTATTVAPAVKMGSKVKVTVHETEDGSQKISIAPQS